MTRREVDLEFGSNEKLWRRIERGDLNANKLLKGNRLRLQVSVVREKHGVRDSVPKDKWNGIAEATAATVAGLAADTLRVECVDEPLAEEQGHALVAMVLRPGDALDQHALPELRLRLAQAFQVVLVPT